MVQGIGKGTITLVATLAILATFAGATNAQQAIFEHTPSKVSACWVTDGDFTFSLNDIAGQICEPITYLHEQGWTAFMLTASLSWQYKPKFLSFHDGFVEGGIMTVRPKPAAWVAYPKTLEPHYRSHGFAWFKVSCRSQIVQFTFEEVWEPRTATHWTAVAPHSDTDPSTVNTFQRLCEPGVQTGFVTAPQAAGGFKAVVVADKQEMERYLNAAIEESDGLRIAKQRAADDTVFARYEADREGAESKLQAALNLIARGRVSSSADNFCLNFISQWHKADALVQQYLDQGDKALAVNEVAIGAAPFLDTAMEQCSKLARIACSYAQTGSPYDNSCKAYMQ